jgi:hypothetical protein
MKMFGFFKKKQKPQASAEEVSVMIHAVNVVIGTQLMLSGKNEIEVLDSKYSLGYLMGVCDATAQKRGIPVGEDLLVIAAVFMSLFPLNPKVFAASLSLAEDKEFSDGQQTGGTDLNGMMSAGKIAPLGLFDYWKANRVTAAF